MSLLKDKPFKKCHTDKRKMIDDIHSEMISDLSEEDLNEYYLENGRLLDQYYRNDKTNATNDIKGGGILSYFDNKDSKGDKEVSNTNIMNEYLSNIDDHILNEKHKDIKNDICEICQSQMLMSDLSSEIFCSSCGASKKIMIITDKVSYSDPQSEITYYTYKRINHFNEWLAQFQAKERTDLPSEIYTKIIDEVKKKPHVSANDLKYNDIDLILV